MRYVFPAIEISIVRHWQMKKLFYNTKSGLMMFDFCPAGSTSALRFQLTVLNWTGVNPVLDLNNRLKCWGYSNPRSNAI